jgi:hypothetical protein
MISLAAFVLLTVVPGGQDATRSEQSTLEKLVADLGAADPQVRDHAEEELRKQGRDAVPALRKAARSNNAERAMRARALLLEMAQDQHGQDRPSQGLSPTPRIAVLYEDWTQGIRFAMNPDGAVELTVPEKDEKTGKREYRTYQASSIEEFRKKYPDVARKYDPEKFVHVREIPAGDELLREWLGLKDPSEGGEESEGRRFGILISPVSPALTSHLGLREGEGLLVQRVQAGSLAEKSGLKPFDVIVKLNDEKTLARKYEEFRRNLQDALGSSAFTLEVIRGGKHETIQVTPPHEEKKEKVK